MRSRSDGFILLRAFIAVLLAASVAPADDDPNRPDAEAAVWDSLVSLLEPQSPPARMRTEAGTGTTQAKSSEAESLIDSLIDHPRSEPNAVESSEPNRTFEPDEMQEPNAASEPNYPPEPQGVPAPRYPAESTGSTVYFLGHDWTVDVLGSAAFGDSKGQLYSTHLSFESLIWRNWTLALQPFVGVGVGNEDDAAVVGLDHVFKYPVWTNGATKVNFEGGGGFQQAGPDSWPDDASHFNFRAILGGGIEWDTARDRRLLFGARWLHVGNLNIDRSENPEANELMLYGGFRWRF